MPHFHISKGIPSPVPLPLALGKHGLLLVSAVTCSLNISSEHSHAVCSFCSASPTRCTLRFVQVLACHRTSLLSIIDHYCGYTPCGLFIHHGDYWSHFDLGHLQKSQLQIFEYEFLSENVFSFSWICALEQSCRIVWSRVSRGFQRPVPFHTHQQSCPLILVVCEWYLIVVLTCISWQWQWLVTKFVGYLSIFFRKSVYASLLTVFELDYSLSSWWHISILYTFQSSVYEILVLNQPLHLYGCLHFLDPLFFPTCSTSHGMTAVKSPIRIVRFSIFLSRLIRHI